MISSTLNSNSVGFSKYVPHKEGGLHDELSRLRNEIKSYKMKIMISADPSTKEVIAYRDILRQTRLKYDSVLQQLNKTRMTNKRRAVRTATTPKQKNKFDVYTDLEEKQRNFYNDSIKVFSGDGKIIKNERKFSSVEFTYRTPVLDVVVY
jgi:hypothetical protein